MSTDRRSAWPAIRLRAGSVLKFLMSSVLIAMVVSLVFAQPPSLLWGDPEWTDDVAVSKNGECVATSVAVQIWQD